MKNIWWQSPSTSSDRLVSVLMGIGVGMWLGSFVGIVYETPVHIENVGSFALCGVILGVIFGFPFPKGSRVIFFSFLFFNVSCN